MTAIRWTLDEAATALADPALRRTIGPASGVPAAVVDFGPDTDTDLANSVTSDLTRLPVVVIGTGESAPIGCDVVVTEPETVLPGIAACPLAAVATAQLLRAGETRSIDEGLLVESLAYAALQGGPEHKAWLAGRGRRVRTDHGEPRVEVHDGDDGLEIRLVRSRLHNLLDAAMRDQLVDALSLAANREDERVRLRADGNTFCGGGDPAEFGGVADPATAHAIRSSANVAAWIAPIAPRITAEIDGACVGAGVELIAFCGTVVATDRARFRLPELTMGLLPGAGGTVSIPRRIGRQRTLSWLLTGEEITAATARDWGLVDELR